MENPKNCRSTRNSTGQPQMMPPKLPETFRFKNHSTLPKCVTFHDVHFDLTIAAYVSIDFATFMVESE